MKEKLKTYKSELITIIFIFSSVIFFYMDKFLIGSIILLAFIIYSCYLNINLKGNEDKMTVSKVKLNINDNISNMIYPIALL